MNNFFSYLCGEFSAIELATGINNFKKGVIEILSSIIELGGLTFHEDKVGNSTYIGSLYTVVTDSYIALSVWGYCFIRGKVRQDLIMG